MGVSPASTRALLDDFQTADFADLKQIFLGTMKPFLAAKRRSKRKAGTMKRFLDRINKIDRISKWLLRGE